MSEGGKRPGGLTALAVFNFIGCGLDLLGIATLGFMLWCMSEYPAVEEGAETDAPPAKEAAEPAAKPEQADEERAWRQVANEARAHGWTNSRGIIAIVLTVFLVILLLVSGIGYLQQKRFLGRKLGMAYACLSLATIAWEINGMTEAVPRSQIIMAGLLGGLYPLLTFLLLNTTFKEDFVR